MLKGIIFDMDGTITLTEGFHHQAFASVFKKFGVDYLSKDHVRRFAGAGSEQTFKTIFAERGIQISEEDLARCIAEKKELYTKIVQETEIPTVPGVFEFVQKIHKKGLKKIIATGNSNLDAVRFILKKVGLLKYFPDILSIKEVGRGKPFPDVFLEAARRIGCASNECVILEDALNGVQAAKAAGIRCISFETTTKREDLLKAGATVVLKDYYGLTNEVLNSKS
jgi:beta-phosphoglucomutase family hydrolase